MPECGEELRKGFRMGEWIVRPIEGMLVGGMGSRHLQPKSMDVLLCLASSANHIVERNDLIEQVWGHTAVTDEPLTRCIHEIRRELSDTRDRPTYIQTIPKRGYRLIVAVEPVEHDSGSTKLPSEPSPSDIMAGGSLTAEQFFLQLIRRRVVWVGAAYAVVAWLLTRLAVYASDRWLTNEGIGEWSMPLLVLLLLMGFPMVVFFAWSRDIAEKGNSVDRRRSYISQLLLSRQGIDLLAITVLLAILAGLALGFPQSARSPLITVTPRLSSIAVLPFKTVGDEATVDWLGEGIAEDLLNVLAGIDSLKVATRTSSFRQFAPATDVVTVGQDLHVQYVLKGSVSRSGDGLRVNVRLMDAQTRFRLWSQTYDSGMNELFAIQQDIVRQIVAALDLDAPGESKNPRFVQSGVVPPDVDSPTNSIKAYEFYLQARSALQHALAPDSIDAAAEFFTQAIQHDPEFVGAYAGLCMTLVRKLELQADTGVIALADKVCQQGVNMGPDSTDAQMALADLYRVTGRFGQAIEQYGSVIDRDSRAADAYRGIGNTYTRLAAFNDAEQAFGRAIEIKPDFGPGYEDYGVFLSDQGRHREVLEIGRRLIQLDPDNVTGYDLLGHASFSRGQFSAAIAAYREVINRDPTATAFTNLGLSLYYLGRYRDAAVVYQRAAAIAPKDHYIWRNIGDVYMQIAGGSRQAEDSYYMARRLAEDELEFAPDEPIVVGSLAYYCAALGDRECAWKFSSAATDLAPRDPSVHYLMALVNMRLGHDAGAISAAELALELGYPRALFTADPLLAAVRNSPILADEFIRQPTLARSSQRNPRITAIYP
jgi:TolB-like protein/DNA-binding winged helix-turn-helix (wHTH) protein/tetratricopeptide (TPR) repeat protein